MNTTLRIGAFAAILGLAAATLPAVAFAQNGNGRAYQASQTTNVQPNPGYTNNWPGAHDPLRPGQSGGR